MMETTYKIWKKNQFLLELFVQLHVDVCRREQYSCDIKQNYSV